MEFKLFRILVFGVQPSDYDPNLKVFYESLEFAKTAADALKASRSKHPGLEAIPNLRGEIHYFVKDVTDALYDDDALKVSLISPKREKPFFNYNPPPPVDLKILEGVKVAPAPTKDDTEGTEETKDLDPHGIGYSYQSEKPATVAVEVKKDPVGKSDKPAKPEKKRG